MRWVDIIEADPVTMTATVTVRASVTDGPAILEGDPVIIATLEKGIFSHLTGRPVAPADGEAFLAALPLHYRTPHRFATEPQEGDAPTTPVGTTTPIATEKAE